MKRETLMLAQVYDQEKHNVGSWYVSEKLDGIRCFWDSGVTRGLFADQVPWANIAKHGRYVNRIKATGLWTRYFQPIQAPDYWLESLPKIPLDGELTLGRGTWQETASTVKSLDPGLDWERVTYMIFDSPPLNEVLKDGVINNPNVKLTLKNCFGPLFAWHEPQPFYQTLSQLKKTDLGEYALLLDQEALPCCRSDALKAIDDKLNQVTEAGGEGLMLRSPTSFYHPERSRDLLKVKAEHDMEGTVVGYTWAKGTDIGKSLTGNMTNKLLGKMGSLRLRLENGIYFDLSGFTDAEREMIQVNPCGLASERFDHPGKFVSMSFENRRFPRGSKVSFKYRELSNDGKPKEARYWRKAQNESI